MGVSLGVPASVSPRDDFVVVVGGRRRLVDGDKEVADGGVSDDGIAWGGISGVVA
jgi:hypothetical protein